MRNKEIFEILKQKKHPIYIWGSGELGQLSHKKLSDNGIEPDGFVTNVKTSDKSVKTPEDIKKITAKKDDIYI